MTLQQKQYIVETVDYLLGDDLVVREKPWILMALVSHTINIVRMRYKAIPGSDIEYVIRDYLCIV